MPESSSPHTPPFIISAVLVDLHHPNPAANDVDGDEGDLGDACGPVNVDSVQQVIAAKWAVDVINNQSLPHELKIGERVRKRSYMKRAAAIMRMTDAFDWIDK